MPKKNKDETTAQQNGVEEGMMMPDGPGVARMDVENNGDKTIVIETIHYQTLVNQFIQLAKKNIMTNESVS